MLRNASSPLCQTHTITALHRALSSSSSSWNNAAPSGPTQHATKPRLPLRKSEQPRDRNALMAELQARIHAGRERTTQPPYTGEKLAKSPKPPHEGSQRPRPGAPGWKGKARPSEGPRLLRPAVLSERVKAASHSGLIDDAVELVQNAPLAAQNVIVWNTLLTEVMRHRKYKLAYSLFVDMKRRGFAPNLWTYGTLLQGYTQVENWASMTQQLENVHKLYEGFTELIETLRLQQEDMSDTPNNAITAYINILGKAGLWQRFFDVYNDFDLDRPPSPNNFTYTAVIEALDARRQLPGFTEPQVQIQNASDAKLVWKQVLKASEKLKFPMDSHMLRPMLRILARGGPSDHLFAFDIVREQMGLAPPGQPAEKAKVPLSTWTLDPLLYLCNKANKPALCLHYLEQAIQTDPLAVQRHHCDMALYANAMQAAKGSLNESARAHDIVAFMLEQDVLGAAEGRERHIRPRIRTLRLALVACWRGSDWDTAVRLFERLTQRSMAQYADATKGEQKEEKEGAARDGWIEPDTSVMSLLARTALASGDPASMRQCLRLVDDIGRARLQGEGMTNTDKEKELPYFWVTYAQSVVDLVNVVVKADAAGNAVAPKEKKAWESLKKTAKQQLALRSEWQHAPAPEVEASRLGSVRGMSAMDAHVDYQMTHRHLKSAM